jgi:group II intron reverse transcriptase/maturase
MMHGMEKSDSSIVAMKQANKQGKPSAEFAERRDGAEGNPGEARTCRTQSRVSVTQGLARIRKVARTRKTERFTSLLRHVDVALLTQAYYDLKRKAAAGIDGLTWKDYEKGLAANLADLHVRVHKGTYRPLPSRRKYIPKPDGRMRPLGITALEDKIVQRAVVEVLNAVYEADFQGFSYGFRPGRSQHDALDALAVGITRTKVKWVLDADIAGFFDTVSHEWMIRFLEHRIGDPRMIRLIGKWLKAGVMEEGTVIPTEAGTPQGAVISPLLANIYLHYVFDDWAKRWRRGKGNIILVRYADDIVAGFQYESEAKSFLIDLKKRMGQFNLSLHTEKTRLIEFGRYAAGNRTERGLGKPETFNFLGFTHICGNTHSKGDFLLVRITRRDKMRAKLKEIKDELRRRMHQSIPEQGKWLRQVITGYFAYHAIPTNYKRLAAFRHYVKDLWRRTLCRRSQRGRFAWDKINRIALEWLPFPRILHPWPYTRFSVKHPRWEPGA